MPAAARMPQLVLLISLLTGAASTVVFSGTATAATLQITELSDMDLGEVPAGTSRLRQRMRFCVAMTPAGPYQITANGTRENGRFVLTNGAGTHRSVAFDLFISGRGQGRGRRLQPGIPRGGLSARPPRADGSCRRPFVQLRLQVDRAGLSSAASGHYSGQIQLTVAPE